MGKLNFGSRHSSAGQVFASVGEFGRPHYLVTVGITGSNPVGGAEVHPPRRVLTSFLVRFQNVPLGPLRAQDLWGRARVGKTVLKTAFSQLSQLGCTAIFC